MAKKRTGRQRQVNTETVPESIYLFLAWFCGALALLCGGLILVIMPFYFRQGYTSIGSDKSYFLRTGCRTLYKVILPVWGVALLWKLGIQLSRSRKEKCYGIKMLWNKNDFRAGDLFVLCYGISAVLAYLGSPYRGTALWGTKGWYMGMIPQLAFVALYFLISRYLPVFLARLLLAVALAASSGTFILGYLNRFDVWPIPMENSGLSTYISTIGNINWFCGYMVAVFLAGIGLLWLDRGDNKWKRLSLMVYCFIGFAIAGVQGSDSGVVAIVLVLLVLYELTVKQRGDMKNFLLLTLLLGLSGIFTCIVIALFPGKLTFSSSMGIRLVNSPLPFTLTAMSLFLLRASGPQSRIKKQVHSFYEISAKVLKYLVPGILLLIIVLIVCNTLYPGSIGPLSEFSVFTFDNSWGSHRGASWKIGLKAFGEQDFLHKLIGIGPDCMADFLYQDGSTALKQIAKEAFKNKRLTNAHSEAITILLQMGILGAISYTGMMYCQIRDGLRARKECSFSAACSLCVMGYFLNNIWSFQQSMSTATIFVIMGLGRRVLRDCQAKADKGAI